MADAESIKAGLRSAFRDYDIDGVPASGAHDPDKGSIREWLVELVDLALAAGSTLVVSTVADLAALSPTAVGERAEVRDDPLGDVEDGNGVWGWSGTAWVWLSSLIPSAVQSEIDGLDLRLDDAEANLDALKLGINNAQPVRPVGGGTLTVLGKNSFRLVETGSVTNRVDLGVDNHPTADGPLVVSYRISKASGASPFFRFEYTDGTLSTPTPSPALTIDGNEHKVVLSGTAGKTVRNVVLQSNSAATDYTATVIVEPGASAEAVGRRLTGLAAAAWQLGIDLETLRTTVASLTTTVGTAHKFIGTVNITGDLNSYTADGYWLIAASQTNAPSGSSTSGYLHTYKHNTFAVQTWHNLTTPENNWIRTYQYSSATWSDWVSLKPGGSYGGTITTGSLNDYTTGNWWLIPGAFSDDVEDLPSGVGDSGYLFNRVFGTWGIQSFFVLDAPHVEYRRQFRTNDAGAWTGWEIVGGGGGGSGGSHLAGKVIVCLGDSITGNYNYPGLLALRLGATVYNFGVGGSRLAEHSALYDPFSLYNITEAIKTGDWSVQIAGADALVAAGRADERDKVAAMAALDWSTVDYLITFPGANDLNGGIPLGTIDSPADGTTWMGAYRKVWTDILSTVPTIRPLLLTPMYRERNADDDGLNSDDYPTLVSVSAAVASGSNTGTGSVSAPTGVYGMLPGDYTIKALSGTTFEVRDPNGDLVKDAPKDGVEVTSGTVGVAFASVLSFTMTGTPVVDDEWTVTVVGHYMIDMVDAAIEVAQKFHIPYVDMYRGMPVGPLTASYYLEEDGLHPVKTATQQLIADKAASGLESAY